MKILLLGPERPLIEAFLASFGDEVVRAEKRLTPKAAKLRGVDWLVSWGYRHIIKPEVLDLLPGRAINVHISYLPYNRGADPNLWSFLENSRQGVTIHCIDPGVDTGDILAQEEVAMGRSETLRTSYDRLSESAFDLFRKVWPDIRSGKLTGRKQPAGGSIHRRSDKDVYEHLLVDGWDTKVSELIGKALAPDKATDRKEDSHEH